MNNDLNKKILSDLTVHMKYAKYIPELNRRETWEELVTRNKEMHQKRYPQLTDQIQLAYKYVYDKKVLPIKNTPDFVSSSFIIECKGRANESFPMRWKMFKKYVNWKMKHVTLYKPQNQKECDKVIELITNKNKIK